MMLTAIEVAKLIRDGLKPNNAKTRIAVAHRILAALAEPPAQKPVAWQRRLQFNTAAQLMPGEWQQCPASEATGHFDRQPGYEYRPVFAAPQPAPAQDADVRYLLNALLPFREASGPMNVAEDKEAYIFPGVCPSDFITAVEVHKRVTDRLRSKQAPTVAVEGEGDEAATGKAIFGEGAQARVYDLFRADPNTRGYHADYYKRGLAGIMRPQRESTAYAAWLAGTHARSKQAPAVAMGDALLVEALTRISKGDVGQFSTPSMAVSAFMKVAVDALRARAEQREEPTVAVPAAIGDFDLSAVSPETWWVKELADYWGEGATPSLDNRRAAKVACNLAEQVYAFLERAEQREAPGEAERPANCRNALRDAGKAYPKSGSAVCRDGGLRGCPYERAAPEKGER